MYLGNGGEELQLSDARILISDFNESWRPTFEDRYHLNIPNKVCAPEAMVAETLKQPIAFPADIWAMGCTIFELFAPGDVFGKFFPDFDLAWVRMIQLLGKPPKSWWDAWEERASFYDDEGNWKPKNKPPRGFSGDRQLLEDKIMIMAGIGKYREELFAWLKDVGIERNLGDMGMRFDAMGVLSDEEKRDLVDMLKQIFCWLPGDRASAEDLANGPWMKKWGLPAIAAMEKAYDHEAKRESVASSATVTKHENGALWALHWASTTARGLGVSVRLLRSMRWGIATGWWPTLKRALGI